MCNVYVRNANVEYVGMYCIIVLLKGQSQLSISLELR